MYQRNGVGLNWSTLLSSEKDKEKLIKQIQVNSSIYYDWDKYNHLISIPEERNQDELFKQACRITILKFCIDDTSFAQDLLSEEEFEKCSTCFARKQYDSKLLKSLLSKFCYLLSGERNETLNNLLKLDILRTVKELREQEVEKDFMPLKKQIEKIAAGVKGYCYIATGNPNQFHIHRYRDVTIKQELNDYIKTKYNYDFNQLNGWTTSSLMLCDNRDEFINHLLQKALLNDDEFWEKHNNFNIITFIEVISEVNDSRHAEKIIDYIFAEILKTQYGKSIIEKSLPLMFLDKEEFLLELEARTFRFTFDRFKHHFNLKILSNDSLCYPFSSINSAQEKLQQGKLLIEEFLHEIYPNDFKYVWGILQSEIKTPCSAFSCREQKVCDVDSNELAVSDKGFDKWNMQHIFDYPTFGYHNQIVDREAVAVYCLEYFSEEHIWNRMYLKAYYMLKLVKDKTMCFANLFEVYFDLFQFIEKQTGIKTSYQRNTKGRNEAYSQLKSILNKYHVNSSVEYKSDYIISLLDRKVAIREESERFPVLEQLGDAVYGLALAEMLFYNPNEKNIEATYKDFIRAESQINVATKIGIDKLYLSSYSLPRKYEGDLLIDADRESYTYEQEREQFENERKYIADSLEMIIGTICMDCGYQTAIDFAKQILIETYPNKFAKEFHWEDNQDSKIERDYWTRILPAPYSHFCTEQHVLWQAFDKFFKAYVLGTEDRKTRQYITNSFGDNKLYDDVNSFCFEVNKVFYEYLHKGLKSAINKFSDSAKEKYKELKK